MLQTENLTFSYGKRQILQDLCLHVETGECLAVTGPNGSGKSTLLALLAGVLRPERGAVTCRGRVGYAPQGEALFSDMTVTENLRFFASLLGTSVPETLPLGVGDYASVRVSRLSGGTRKRVSIACALLGEPELLLLDEPCAGLDLCYREALSRLLTERKRRGCAIVYVGHEPAEFEGFYDRVLNLGCGAPESRTAKELADGEGLTRFLLRSQTEPRR